MPSDAKTLRADRNGTSASPLGVLASSRASSLSVAVRPMCRPDASRFLADVPQSERAVGGWPPAPPQATENSPSVGRQPIAVRRRRPSCRRQNDDRGYPRRQAGKPIRRRRRRLPEGPGQQRASRRHRRRDGVADARQFRSREATCGCTGRVQDARRQGAAGGRGAACEGKRPGGRHRIEGRPAPRSSRPAPAPRRRTGSRRSRP